MGRITQRKPNHGWSLTKVYQAWSDAKQRCYKKDHKEFHRYGAKGITMSDEFLDNPVAWCEYLGNPPDNEPRKWSVDRIDCTRGYERGNLQWATSAAQARNHKKSSNNTTGFTGVTIRVDNETTIYYIAWWDHYVEGVSKRGSKTFSVKKHGLLPAFAMACKYREYKIKELNAKGYGYADNHGQ